MGNTKFRQPIFDKDGNFVKFFYFDIKKGEKMADYAYQNNHPKPIFQYIGQKARNGKEIYEGATLSDGFGLNVMIKYKGTQFVGVVISGRQDRDIVYNNNYLHWEIVEHLYDIAISIYNDI